MGRNKAHIHKDASNHGFENPLESGALEPHPYVYVVGSVIRGVAKHPMVLKTTTRIDLSDYTAEKVFCEPYHFDVSVTLRHIYAVGSLPRLWDLRSRGRVTFSPWGPVGNEGMSYRDRCRIL